MSLPKNVYFKKVYDQAQPKVAKYLHADGTIDENPGGSPSAKPLFVFPNSGGGSSILTVATFAEIEIGMKAYSSSETSGYLFMGTVKELDEDQGYLIEEDGKPSGGGYSVYIPADSEPIPFPSF